MQHLLDIYRQTFGNLPGFLDGFIQDHGALGVRAAVREIVFCETGLVVTPFLPGDSLLFTVGAVAARGSMNVWAAAGLLYAAALLGNQATTGSGGPWDRGSSPTRAGAVGSTGC